MLARSKPGVAAAGTASALRRGPPHASELAFFKRAERRRNPPRQEPQSTGQRASVLCAQQSGSGPQQACAPPQGRAGAWLAQGVYLLPARTACLVLHVRYDPQRLLSACPRGRLHHGCAPRTRGATAAHVRQHLAEGSAASGVAKGTRATHAASLLPRRLQPEHAVHAVRVNSRQQANAPPRAKRRRPWPAAEAVAEHGAHSRHGTKCHGNKGAAASTLCP